MVVMIAAGVAAALLLALVSRVAGRNRRSRGAAIVGGRLAVPSHPFLRPPALTGQLKAHRVFVDDWRRAARR